MLVHHINHSSAFVPFLATDHDDALTHAPAAQDALARAGWRPPYTLTVVGDTQYTVVSRCVEVARH